MAERQPESVFEDREVSDAVVHSAVVRGYYYQVGIALAQLMNLHDGRANLRFVAVDELAGQPRSFGGKLDAFKRPRKIANEQEPLALTQVHKHPD